VHEQECICEATGAPSHRPSESSWVRLIFSWVPVSTFSQKMSTYISCVWASADKGRSREDHEDDTKVGEAFGVADGGVGDVRSGESSVEGDTVKKRMRLSTTLEKGINARSGICL
jgi:hypothetical protein